VQQRAPSSCLAHTWEADDDCPDRSRIYFCAIMRTAQRITTAITVPGSGVSLALSSASAFR